MIALQYWGDKDDDKEDEEVLDYRERRAQALARAKLQQDEAARLARIDDASSRSGLGAIPIMRAAMDEMEEQLEAERRGECRATKLLRQPATLHLHASQPARRLGCNVHLGPLTWTM